MIKLLKRMRKREALMALLCAVLVVAQVYFDLKLPDYMTRLTTLIKTPGSVTADILSVGGEMLLCTLASAVLAVGCGYLAAKTASGFSFSVRADLFHHVMDAGSEEMQSFSVPSLITRTTNDITQIQMIVAMGLQMLMKAPIMAVWAVIKILGKSWTLSAVTGGFVVAIVVMVLLIMSSCLPRFRQVQKKTDQINRVARENLTGINVVHAFGAEDYQNRKFDGPSREMMNLQLKNQRLFALLQPMLGFGMNGLALAVYWVGAALVGAGVVFTVMRGKWTRFAALGRWLLGLGVFFTLSSQLMRKIYPAGTTAMCILVPVLMLLSVVFLLYQREFAVQTAALTLTIASAVLLNHGSSSMPALVTAFCWAAMVLVAALLVLTVLLQKHEGSYKGTVIFPAKTNYALTCAVLVLSIAAIAVSLFAGLAYYVIWGAAVLLFVLAVGYTVKML